MGHVIMRRPRPRDLSERDPLLHHECVNRFETSEMTYSLEVHHV